MPLSLEERKAALARGRATAAANRAAKKAEQAAPPAPPPAPELSAFDRLEQAVAERAAEKERRRKVLEMVDAQPELADDPEIVALLDQLGVDHPKRKTEGLRPGSRPMVRDEKGNMIQSLDSVDWKESDLTHPEWGCVNPDGTPQYVTFTPNETIKVWYQGIRCQFIADEEITCLKCFKDVYDEHKRATRIAEQHKAFMFGQTDYLPRELQTSDAAVSTARVRAFMSMGAEKGKGTIINGYPGDDRFGLREVPGGGAASGETTT